MTDTKHIHIKDYNYDLPDERIAKFPVAVRDHSKLLIYNKGLLSEDSFFNIPDYLPSGALMLFNNTRVIQARINFSKITGAHIEVFLLEPACPSDYEQMFTARCECSWYCMIGNLKKWKEEILSREIIIGGRKIVLSATKGEEHGTSHLVKFTWNVDDLSFADILDTVGELPIPPYLNRNTEESDKETYQTVYSKIKGSVAAPTAGLHFTKDVLRTIDAHGVERDELTLHVGAGTFKPVKAAEIAGHSMHTEYFSVKRSTMERLLAHDVNAIAVGTTTVRTLESLYYVGLHLAENPDADENELHINQWEPYEKDATLTPSEAIKNILSYLDRNKMNTFHGSTQIIIAPGYDYKIVKMLVTNFHQPQSTLLLLVSAFVKGDWRHIYDYALCHDFRFLSYGDSSLLIP